MKKDKDKNQDVDMVGFVARQMDLGDFDFFMRAYAEWYGEEPTEAEIEPYFKKYLLNSVAPFWVRHYARNYLNDPELVDRLAKESKSTHLLYFIPLLIEYLIIMYFYLARA
ncbi:MAG: hypothetical protein R3231_08630 [bacterium]|nr:hypothetical protein [bacterium]